MGVVELINGRLAQWAKGAARLMGLEVTRSRRADAPPEHPWPFDLDDNVVATIRAVAPYTLTSPAKIAGFCEAVRYTAVHRIPGALVECGVWRGGSMMAAARTLVECGDMERDLYLLDTFEGMVPPGPDDVRHDQVTPHEMMRSILGDGAKLSDWCAASVEDVLTSLSSVGYPSEKIHLVKGRVEDTIPGQAPERIAILRLDTDWYESTRHELRHLFPRIVSGGVLIVDDYGFWQGARKAVDEYLRESGARILLNRLEEGRIGVVQ